ncbi:MotA/TolQ/ExbB proton channel family protein [bacterium]|nr:MotA/TolQ/ExbB proton channel family protein [bacterium]
MRKTAVLILMSLFVGVFMMTTQTAIEAQEINAEDSLWVHLSSGLEGKEEGNLTLNFVWELYKKPYNTRSKKFGAWEEYSDPSLTFKVVCSTDSNFSVIAKTAETNNQTYTIRDLDFGQVYFIRVDLVNVDNPWKSDAAEGKVFKRGVQEREAKKGVFKSFLAYSKAGGTLMPAIYGLAIFGLLIVLPVTWWKLRLANIFPPNKPGFIYAALPTNQTGKTDLKSPKGNLFIKEVARYWKEAMKSMSLELEYWDSTEKYIKASRQETEEAEKRTWLDIGKPNVEKALEVCRNGVPGIKLKKDPMEYPFTRVFVAALENHRSNQNNWWASQEMDRATENTAIKELDSLKGWSLNALWAIGSIEPMLGLFGTVIGIRGAFVGIEEMIKENPDAQLTQVVPQLAGGIHVALITTITGLAIGVPFMLFYYYYRGKLDWIYGKWEEIIIDILNRA